MSGVVSHVLVTTDAVGGVFNHTLALVEALGARGVEADVAVLGPPPSPDQRAQLAAVSPRGVHQLAGALEWMPDPWEDVARCGSALLELEADLRPEIIHASAYFCGAVPFQAPVTVVAHSCVYSWWHAVHRTSPPAAWARYRDTVRAGLRGADAVVAPTRTMLAELDRRYGVEPRRALAILNGAAPEPGAAPKEGFVLAAGRMWDPAKNLAALLDAADDLPGPVLIAGDLGTGPMDPEATPAPHNVRLLGRLAADRLADLRRRARVFAAPARYEPFGLAILEAAGARCALVLGDIPSLRELWEGCAEFVAPEDHEALRHRLAGLLRRPERAARLAQRARRQAERLTPALMATAYLDLYRELILERAACA